MDDTADRLTLINDLFTNAVEDSLLVMADIVNSDAPNEEKIAAAKAVASFAPLFKPEVKYVVAEGGGGMIQ